MNVTLEQAGRKYLNFIEATKAKAQPTLDKERCSLNGWFEFTGKVSLTDLGRDEINAYAVERADEGVSNRTINLDILSLKHVLLFARDSKLVPSNLPLATDSWKPLKHTTPRRDLIPHEAVDAIVAECLKVEGGLPKHYRGQFLADYIKLLAYSGARKTAGLTAKWKHVDWKNLQVTFFTKFDKWVVVDMNPKLEAHLRDMEARRTDSEFLFPGDYDGHQGDPHRAFDSVRQGADHPGITLHDFRHFFASHAVMSGTDVLTVARWLGHSDGGRLVSAVYGHLNQMHLKRAAEKVRFGETE